MTKHFMFYNVGWLLFKGEYGCFQYERRGCLVSNELSKWLIANYNINNEQVFHKGTSERGSHLAMYATEQICHIYIELVLIDADLGVTEMTSIDYEKI